MSRNKSFSPTDSTLTRLNCILFSDGLFQHADITLYVSVFDYICWMQTEPIQIRQLLYKLPDEGLLCLLMDEMIDK